MAAYSVAQAKTHLPSLIDRAMAGEEVVITRHGKPVAQLRPTMATDQRSGVATYEWLRARRGARPSIGKSSVDVLNEMYEETDD